LVFGARAGKAAAAYAAGQNDPGPVVHAQAEDEVRRLERDYLRRTMGTEHLADLRVEMHKTMEEHAGIFRAEASLQQAAETLRKLQDRFRGVALEDRSHTFNTQLIAALELGCMLDVAEAIVSAALERRESRGAHQRTDYPQRDDAKFLAHSLIFRSAEGPPRVELLPVTITRWPPGQRVYGR
jgi:fumarate reductase flavoprotein subunit